MVSDSMSCPTFSFSVPGNPQPKERPRIAVRGRFARAYTPAKTLAYEKLVAECAKASMPDDWPMSTHYSVVIRAYRADRRRVDLDNIVKSVLDAINGVAFDDDHLVVEIAASKMYDKSYPRVDVHIISYLGYLRHVYVGCPSV
jgi:Holliday junction resolvase RusA-like endonuclease